MRPLALLGMSGVGKSFWAKKLEARGWLRIDCDGEIAARLGELISIEAGEEPVRALGVWMGMPWTRGYREREAAYLTLEEEITASALERAQAAADEGRDVVVDCTGSVIYLPSSVVVRLTDSTERVYLQTPVERRAAMLARYVAEPKPVVWADSFVLGDGESGPSALPRLYAELLRFRDARYGALAMRTIDGGWLEQAPESEGLTAIAGRRV